MKKTWKIVTLWGLIGGLCLINPVFYPLANDTTESHTLSATYKSKVEVTETEFPISGKFQVGKITLDESQSERTWFTCFGYLYDENNKFMDEEIPGLHITVVADDGGMTSSTRNANIFLEGKNIINLNKTLTMKIVIKDMAKTIGESDYFTFNFGKNAKTDRKIEYSMNDFTYVEFGGKEFVEIPSDTKKYFPIGEVHYTNCTFSSNSDDYTVRVLDAKGKDVSPRWEKDHIRLVARKETEEVQSICLEKDPAFDKQYKWTLSGGITLFDKNNEELVRSKSENISFRSPVTLSATWKNINPHKSWPTRIGWPYQVVDGVSFAEVERPNFGPCGGDSKDDYWGVKYEYMTEYRSNDLIQINFDLDSDLILIDEFSFEVFDETTKNNKTWEVSKVEKVGYGSYNLSLSRIAPWEKTSYNFTQRNELEELNQAQAMKDDAPIGWFRDSIDESNITISMFWKEQKINSYKTKIFAWHGSSTLSMGGLDIYTNHIGEPYAGSDNGSDNGWFKGVTGGSLIRKYQEEFWDNEGDEYKENLTPFWIYPFNGLVDDPQFPDMKDNKYSNLVLPGDQASDFRLSFLSLITSSCFYKRGEMFSFPNESERFEISLVDRDGNESENWSPSLEYYGRGKCHSLNTINESRNYPKESSLTDDSFQYVDIVVDAPDFEDDFEGFYSLTYKKEGQDIPIEVYRSTLVKFSTREAFLDEEIFDELAINKTIAGAMTLNLSSKDSLNKTFTGELVDEKNNAIPGAKVTVSKTGGTYRMVNVSLPENEKNYSLDAKVKIYKNKEMFIESNFNTYNYYNWEITHSRNPSYTNTDECYISNFARVVIKYMSINDVEFYFEDKNGQKIDGLEIKKAYTPNGFTTTIDLDLNSEKNSQTVLTYINLVVKRTSSSTIFGKYYYDAMFLKYMIKGTSLPPNEIESGVNACLVNHHKKDENDFGDSQGDQYLAPFVPGWADDFEKCLPRPDWPSSGYHPLFSLNHPHQLNLNEGLLHFKISVKEKNGEIFTKDYCKVKYILKQTEKGTDIQVWRIYFNSRKELEKIKDKEIKCEVYSAVILYDKNFDIEYYVGKVIGVGRFTIDTGAIYDNAQ